MLAQQEIAELRAANEAASRRKSHKRKRIQNEGTLVVEEGQRLAALREFGARSDGKKQKKRVRAEGGEPPNDAVDGAVRAGITRERVIIV